MFTKGLRLAIAICTLFVVLASAPPKANALGTPQIIVIDPPSPSPVGTSVRVRAKVNWDSDFSCMRMRFGSGGWEESCEIEYERNFSTGHLAAGWYPVRVEVKSVNDPNWSNPTSTEANYQLTAGSAPPTATPAPVTPYGPVVSQVIFSPDSATVGQIVGIHIKVESTNPGAIRIYVPCGGVAHFEHTVPEYDTTWNTGGCGSGWQNVRVCARHVNDPNWQYAYCVDKSIFLNQAATSAPSADFWADTGTISQGQCTWIHWKTTNASAVDIDGSYVAASGDMQVCPTVTKHYSLKAVGAGGEATRSLSIVVSAVATQPSVSGSFKTGDVIQIGYDVFVIVGGERRLVPNPETLDALGIPRSWINNKGFSVSQLNTILKGRDIPDVNRDPSGFRAFKNTYFPNTKPIVPSTATPRGGTSGTECPGAKTPRMVAGGRGRVTYGEGRTGIRVEPQGVILERLAEGTEFDVVSGPVCTEGLEGHLNWWFVRLDDGRTGWVPEGYAHTNYWIEPRIRSLVQPTRVPTKVPTSAPQPTAKTGGGADEWIPGREQLTCQQVADAAKSSGIEVKAAEPVFTWCTQYVFAERKEDMSCWAQAYGDAGTWDELARTQKAIDCGITINPTIRGQPANPKDIRVDDIVVWESNCGGIKPPGHVALVTVPSIQNLGVNEANRNGDGKVHLGSTYHNIDLSCTSFIHKPAQAGQTASPQQQPSGNESRNVFERIAQAIRDLWQSFWGK